MDTVFGAVESVSSISSVVTTFVWSRYITFGILIFLFVATIYRICLRAAVKNIGYFLPDRDEVEPRNDGDVNDANAIPKAAVVLTDGDAIAKLMEIWKISTHKVAAFTYSTYRLWLPLIMRRKQGKDGAPAWFAIANIMTHTSTLIIALSILMFCVLTENMLSTQNPILNILSCSADAIDHAVHCDPHTEGCYITPPCGPHPVDYNELLHRHRALCDDTSRTAINVVQNICFMDQQHETNSWNVGWKNLVGADFHALETTLIKFYRDPKITADVLIDYMKMPVRVIYDQKGSLVGYGVNAVDRFGRVTYTNLNYDDLMTILTTWRQKKLSANVQANPCICAPHLGILSRMIFIWEQQAGYWDIYLDHNITSTNIMYGEGNIVPRYSDFPRNVALEIEAGVTGSGRIVPNYPGASTVELLRAELDLSRSRPLDIQTARTISRYWALREQHPHVYFDASLALYSRDISIAGNIFSRTQSTLSGMAHGDVVVETRRLVSKEASCYYQCARIFDTFSD